MSIIVKKFHKIQNGDTFVYIGTFKSEDAAREFCNTYNKEDPFHFYVVQFLVKPGEYVP